MLKSNSVTFIYMILRVLCFYMFLKYGGYMEVITLDKIKNIFYQFGFLFVFCLLSRLFKSYDPINLAGKDKDGLVKLLSNNDFYKEIINLDRISAYISSKKRSGKNVDIWGEIDKITSRKLLVRIIGYLLKNCNIDSIDNAAKVAGRVICDLFRQKLDY